MNKKLLFFSIFIILFIFIYTIYYKTNQLLYYQEKFTNQAENDDIFDKEYVDFYEIIYRDFDDIDYDYKIVKSKVLDKLKNPNNLHILVAGSGVGKWCKKLKDSHDNVIGIDNSQNMFFKAKSMYPNIKFVHNNLKKNSAFKRNEFGMILLDERAIYYNTIPEQEIIIKNIYNWLDDRGFLIIQIYDPKKLQVAARYYSSNYMDNKGYLHGFTYLNNFSHDCYYIPDIEDKERIYYYDKIVLQDNGNKRIKKSVFYIQDKEKMYNMILKNGFEIFYIEDIHRQIVGGYELAILRKKDNKTTVNKLQENMKN